MGLFRFKKQKLGKGFGDFLEKGDKWNKGEKGKREEISLIGRIGDIGPITILFLGGVVLFGRLFYLTLIRGDYFRDLAENNRVREETVPAARGVIYDQEGRVLARNRPIYKIKNQKLNSKNTEPNLKIISREEALRLESWGEKVVIELGREYPEREVTAHIVGYMAEVSEADLQCQMSNEFQNPNSKCQKYYLGDWRGRTGAEAAFEEVLRGIPGKRLVEVDVQGKEIRELGRVEPLPGENLYLSLDLDLQKAAAGAMREGTTLIGNNPVRVVPLKGAVVVSDPWTGEILALYSSPSFEPNIFVGEVRTMGYGDDARRVPYGNPARIEDRSPKLEEILNNPSQPLFNRAIAGLYPPGSTFKIITAVAGLETGVIDEETTVEDTGVISIGPYRFPNWYFIQYGRKEGEVDLVKAIKRSNDIFFYKVGEWLGIERLEQWAKAFGLNTKLGIEIAGEASGIVRHSRDWFLGDTYHLAIGQGDLLVTPLQVNSWASVIANGGKLCRPTVLNLSNLSDLGNLSCQDLGLSEKTVRLITEGMKKACEVGGTGWPLFNFEIRNQKSEIRKIPVACKTGTAEYGDLEEKTHAWLTAFAPAFAPQGGASAGEPEIVVTVLVEGGGEGSSVAGPIVKKLLEEWFGR